MTYVRDIIVRANFEAADQAAANQIAEEIAKSIVDDAPARSASTSTPTWKRFLRVRRCL